MTPPPLLLAMPYGLQIGGVTTFAVRLANGLAARGRPVAVLLHPERASDGQLDVAWHGGVEIIRVDGNFEDCPGDLSPFVPVYRDAARRMAAQSGRPAVLAPQMLGDCYGVAAALCTAEPETVRILGWQHSDIEYDTRVLERYEPIIARFVAVSDRIEATLKERLGARAGDLVNVPYGVEVGPAAGVGRSSMETVRLIYTGRLEHEQKRIMALVEMSAELERRGVVHALTVVGDGPAAGEFVAAAKGRPIECIGAASPARVAALLREHDALVLPSRYEGLSVSMLEAMAAGCVPVLARTRSGAGQAVESGYNGEIAEVAYDADERAAGAAMAEAVARFTRRNRNAMSAAATQTVRERYSIERHVERIAALADQAASAPPRPWPSDRACAFSVGSALAAGSPGSGSVPAEGAAKLNAALQRLAGRKVVIHGTGQHTLQLGAVLAGSPAAILAFADDDRAQQGKRLWNWPIIAPGDAAEIGATDVLISSWMHEEAIWERRGVYERQGLRVHRLYRGP